MQKLIVTLLVFLSISTSAQQNYWMYLPNSNLIKGAHLTDTAYRIEDIYFTDTLHGFAVTLTNRLFKTKDGGLSWQVKNDTSNPLFYPGYRSVEFLDDGKYGIAGSLGYTATILQTNDSGETWLDITGLIVDTTKGYTKRNICGLAHYGTTFYGVGSWGSTTAKFYKSTDRGDHWQTTYMDTNVVKNLVDVVFISQDTGFVTGARNNESLILKTTDGGASWTKIFSDVTIGGRIWKL